MAILADMLMRPSLVRAARAALALAMVLQTYLLYAPVHGEGSLPANADKLVHMAMFGGPALLALLGRWRWVPLVLAAYAPVSELIQGTHLVDRDFDWLDIVADVSGIIVVVALWHFARRR